MVAIFQSNVNSGAITGRPNAVRQIPDWNGRDQSWSRAALIDLHLVGPTHRDVGKFALAVICKVHVIRNRSRVKERKLLEGRLGAEHLYFADVLQRNPDFVIFRAYSDVRTKGTGLGNPLDDLMRSGLDHRKFGSKA